VISQAARALRYRVTPGSQSHQIHDCLSRTLDMPLAGFLSASVWEVVVGKPQGGLVDEGDREELPHGVVDDLAARLESCGQMWDFANHSGCASH